MLIYQRQVKLNAPIEIIEADAAEYLFGVDENVFFLFNPFDGVILRRFLENISQSLVQHPRKIWLIYDNPVWRNVIDQHEAFVEVNMIAYANTESIVYVNPC